MKKLKKAFATFLTREREYDIGGVTYLVSSQFEPAETGTSIRSRLEGILTNDLIDLANLLPADTIAAEYVCSAAEKEVS